MKRFTNDARNEQEGWGISPHRKAEEEEALSLSFEGEAGARTLSRRQALGLLGGSLAGASGLSFGLANPAKSAPLPFGTGDVITLECQIEGPRQTTYRWLDGRTGEGNVGLAPNTNPPYTGTKWRVVVRTAGTAAKDGIIHLRCLGAGNSNLRWLDGVTGDGSVQLAPTTAGKYTGTSWRVVPGKVSPDQTTGDISLECLGTGPGNKWLVGRRDRAVGLAPQAGSPATTWHYRILP